MDIGDTGDCDLRKNNETKLFFFINQIQLYKIYVRRLNTVVGDVVWGFIP